MCSGEATDHHGSHRDLLWVPEDLAVVRQDIDAVIVPTARPPVYLAHAAGLAQALDCPLVTLHSKQWTNAAKAAQRLSQSVDLIAMDIADPADLRLPAWETSRLLAGTVFARRTDLSAKRNLALMLSRMLGWSRIVFLDDDITRLNPADMRRASGLLGTHHAVGLNVNGFPDHSVVCHAYRDAGGQQQSFIGGGALVVQVDRSESFFPDIYNDDWFFLLDGEKSIQPTAVIGQVRQYPYDPFRNPDRARAQELGDVLAEGIYWLLDQGGSVMDADHAYWKGFLAKRRRFIERVMKMVESQALDSADRTRRVAALKGSLGRLTQHITPDLCTQYLQAWLTDRRRWHRHLARLPIGYIGQLPASQHRPHALEALSRPGRPQLNWKIGASGILSVAYSDHEPGLVRGPCPSAAATGGLKIFDAILAAGRGEPSAAPVRG